MRIDKLSAHLAQNNVYLAVAGFGAAKAVAAVAEWQSTVAINFSAKDALCAMGLDNEFWSPGMDSCPLAKALATTWEARCVESVPWTNVISVGIVPDGNGYWVHVKGRSLLDHQTTLCAHVDEVLDFVRRTVTAPQWRLNLAHPLQVYGKVGDHTATIALRGRKSCITWSDKARANSCPAPTEDQIPRAAWELFENHNPQTVQLQPRDVHGRTIIFIPPVEEEDGTRVMNRYTLFPMQDELVDNHDVTVHVIDIVDVPEDVARAMPYSLVLEHVGGRVWRVVSDDKGQFQERDYVSFLDSFVKYR